MTEDRQNEITAAVATAVAVAIEEIETKHGSNGRNVTFNLGFWQFLIAILTMAVGIAFQTGVLITAVNGRINTIEERIVSLREDVQENRQEISQNRAERWAQIERLDDRVRVLETKRNSK